MNKYPGACIQLSVNPSQKDRNKDESVANIHEKPLANMAGGDFC